MRRPFNLFLKVLAYCLTLFLIIRLNFLAWNFKLMNDAKILEVLQSLIQGLSLDISTACYVLAIFVIFQAVFIWLKPFISHRINKGILNLVTCVYIIIGVSDAILYSEWGGKVDYRAITHLANPSEVVASAGTEKTIIVIVLVFVFFYMMKRTIDRSFKFDDTVPTLRQKIWIFIFCILSIPAIIIGLRGGIKQIPISQSDAFFSNNSTLNNTAVNPAWNLLHSLIQNLKEGNHNKYKSMDVAAADSILKETVGYDGEYPKLLTTQNPDIVFIILESWSADFIGSCGGDPFTPVFDSLSKDGFLFTNAIASGLRSDQGMAAIFSGFPAQPNTSITKQPGKTEKLGSIIKSLNNKGYTSSYLFGGQLRYANLKSYLVHSGFQTIREESDLDPSLPKGKLGIPDKYMFDEFAKELKTKSSPFISTLFTGSTHSPYDMPDWEMKKFTRHENEYINSAVYTDQQLKNFFDQMNKTDQHKNILYILVADHSHNSHKRWDMNSPEYHHIPMLFFGEVIDQKYRGMTFDKVCSQTDLGSILLNQLNIASDSFRWSRNVLSRGYKPSAYYAIPDGLGWVVPEGSFLYVYPGGVYNKNINDSALIIESTKAKAYLQCLFEEYLSY